MSSRGNLMVTLALNNSHHTMPGDSDVNLINRLNIPYYEFQSVSKEERETAIKGFSKQFQDNKTSELGSVNPSDENNSVYNHLQFFEENQSTYKAEVHITKENKRLRTVVSSSSEDDINLEQVEEEKGITTKQIVKSNDGQFVKHKFFEENQSTYEAEVHITKEYKRSRAVVSSSSEDDINLEQVEEEKGITTKQIVKSNDGQFVKNKGHCCLFCHKIMMNLARHFEIMHSEEIEVAKLLSMKKKSSERRKGFIELSRLGDYYHNCEVLSTKQGQLILVRRPNQNEPFSYDNYTPCPLCSGFLHKRHLWHHARACAGKQEKSGQQRKFLSESKVLLHSAMYNDVPAPFVNHILAKFRDDEISKCCKSDLTILKFGVLQFEKYGSTQCELIRQQMRQLSRLLVVLNQTSTNNKNEGLSYWLQPTHFDSIVNSVKTLCLHDDPDSLNKRPNFSIPSLALKLGHAMKKCISIERGIALRNCDGNRNESLKDLISLVDLEWSSKISSNALATLHNRKLNRIKVLPLTTDLVKLNKYLQSHLIEMQDPTDSVEWRRLAEVVLCKLVLFNKRRSGETAKLPLRIYLEQNSGTPSSTEESLSSLTELEKKLSSRLSLIQTIGKRGNHVPILITPDVKEKMDVLARTRDLADINQNNEFFLQEPMVH